MHQCPECGARYSSEQDSCAARFEQLLALDHSRQEPWGSRHGRAFAVFALQHPIQYSASADRGWQILYRIYVLHEAPSNVIASMRAGTSEKSAQLNVAPRPPAAVCLPAITIADLGDFAAGDYATALDAWCRATLDAWGVATTTDAA
jgi:hypothetical protein